MTEFTYDEDLFSDLYKDANGFRPRSHEFYWDETTPQRKQEIWDATIKDLNAEIEYQEQAQKESVVKFEKLVEETIESGAGDRETAIHWLRTAEDDEYMENDDGYFEYTYNLPYGYLKGHNQQ